MLKKFLLVCLILLVRINAYSQTFQFLPDKFNQVLSSYAISIDTAATYHDPVQIVVDDKFSGYYPNPSAATFQYKSVQDYVILAINHDSTMHVHAYKYAVSLHIVEYTATTMTSPHSFDTIMNISYNPDSLQSYNDLTVYKFSGFNQIQVFVTDIHEISGAMPSPVSRDSVAHNFYVEADVVVERFDNAPASIVPTGSASSNNQYLDVSWVCKNSSNTTITVKPIMYELEWTYIDDYADPAAGVGPYLFTSSSGNAINFDFRNNSTRIITNNLSYSIPLVYEHGAVIYRVRGLRPASTSDYKNVTYTDWSLADYGSLSYSGLSGKGYVVATPHDTDKLNWQYTINFAEEGKYKHVINYFDGALKNRQTQTKINTDNSYVIAADKVYDYEGRPAIQSLPTPVLQNYLQYRGDILLNNYTAKSYAAGDFDRIGCTLPDSLAPLSSAAQANIYYSPLNPKLTPLTTAGMMRFVPDAKGYPFVQTVYSADNTNKILWQGGAGKDMQLWKNHGTHYTYVTAVQPELDPLMGTEIGDSQYYPKQVVTDANGQSSFTILNHAGKVLITGLQGSGPDSSKVPIDLLSNYVGGQQYCSNILGTMTQNVSGNSLSAEKSYYSDNSGTNRLTYSVSIPPYLESCTGKYLLPQAYIDISAATDCGVPVFNSDTSLGISTWSSATTSLYTKLPTFSATLQEGKYILNKNFSIDQHNTDSLSAAFVNQNEPTCFHDSKYFIYNAVESAQFPCVDSPIISSCAANKATMLSELYPGAKYGKYNKNATGGFGNCTDSNSIFTTTYIQPFGNIADLFAARYVAVTPPGLTINGVAYPNFLVVPTDTFIYYFNDQIAEALLPLHPEYCKLALCDDGIFITTFKGLKTYQQAISAGLFNLNDIAASDPIYQNSANVSVMTPATILNRLESMSGLRIDSMAIQQAYCNGGNTDVMQQCLISLYHAQIDSLSFVNSTVEQTYFELLQQMYIGNRTYLEQQLQDNMGNTCAPYAQYRMKVTGNPIYPTVFVPSTAGTGSIDSTQNTLPSWINTAFNKAASGDTSFSGVPAGLTDSITAYNTTLGNAQIDAVIKGLSNCVMDTGYLGIVRAYLLAKAAAGVIITPDIVDTAITSNTIYGFTINDLCNPYLAAYGTFATPARESDYVCGDSALYAGMQAFLNIPGVITAIEGATTGGSSVNTILLVSGNEYEAKLQAFLGSSSVQVQGFNQTISGNGTQLNYTQLTVSNGGTSTNIFINKNWAAVNTGTINSISATWPESSGSVLGGTSVGTGLGAVGNSIPDSNVTGYTGLTLFNSDGYHLETPASGPNVNWPSSPTDQYSFDFPISPATGYDVNITGFSFKLKWSGNTPLATISDSNNYPYMMARMGVSIDGGAFTLIGSAISNPTGASVTIPVQAVNVTCNSGHTMMFRLYLYTSSGATHAANHSRNVYLGNVSFTGNTYLDGTLSSGTIIDSFNNPVCINNSQTAALSGYIAKGTALINAYANGSTTPGTYYVWCKNIDLMTPFSGGAIANSITCWDIEQGINAFKNDQAKYGYDTHYNHPLFSVALTNYLNYHFKASYVYDDYYQLMNGCAVTNVTSFNNYTSTYRLQFSSDDNANIFLGKVAGFGSGRSVFNFRFKRTNDSVVIFNDLNSVPKDSLLIYKNLLSGTLSGHTFATTNATYLYSSPDSNLIFTKNPFSNFSLSTYAGVTGDREVTVYESGIYNTYRANTFAQNSGTSVLATTQAQATIDSLVNLAGEATYKFYNNAVLRSADYYTPIKQQYLGYVYSHGASYNHNQVISAIAPDSLKIQLSNFSGKIVTYNDPLCTAYTTDLYAFYPSQTSFHGYTTLTTVLNAVKGGLGYNHLFTNALATTISSQLKVFKKANGDFWYQYFDGSNNLYNVYVMPPTNLVNSITRLKMDSLQINGGADSIYSFTVYLHDSTLAAIPVACPGYTTFALGYSQKVSHVVLQKNPNSDYCTDSLDCEYTLLHTAINNGQAAYANYFDSLTHSLSAKMINYWLSNATDTLILCYQGQKYQYTKYYYDRAGNLERTVPPSGVNLVMAPAVAIEADRISNTVSSATKANDNKVSAYRYNARNELVWQQTPDGGISTFYYDAAGRLIFSQNSRQSATGLYSYILYDAQSRPMETGEGVFPATLVQGADGKGTNSWADTEYYAACNCTFANVVRTYARNDVVLTTYDTMKVNLGVIAGLDTQQNLRKRVSAISYFNTLAGLTTAFQAAYRPTPIFTTHYSYDLAGNVATVVYDYPYLADVKQQYKRVDYDFDLLSGKVNMLSYNRGRKDQFYQQYDYDADNRITTVNTSGDGVIWNKDARYTYYPHGPLATLKIGDNLLQSIEYAYTIQGWLKAMNGDVLRTDKDMGQNGLADLTYARDAVAHALHYYQNDYSPIDNTASVTNLPEPAKGLYNGNIVQQNTAIGGLPDMQRTYRYDQLQRLKLVSNGMVSESDLTVTPTMLYNSSYAYDADGNIKTLARKGSSTTNLDTLVYHYPTGNNRLQQVENYASSASTLLPGQGATNYRYDSTGQLVYDQAGHIKVQWTPYGKVRQVLDTITKVPINYTYDGNGNRVYKDIVNKYSANDEEHYGEYYVHDATGNILAVYRVHNVYAPIVVISAQNTGINGAAGSATLAGFIATEVAPATGFSVAFTNAAAAVAPSWTSAQTTAVPTSFYTSADPVLYSGLLTNSNGYLNDLRSYTDGTTPAGQIISQALYNSPGSLYGYIKSVIILDSGSGAANALFSHFSATMPIASVDSVWAIYGLTPGADSTANGYSLDSAITASQAYVPMVINGMVAAMTGNIADTVAAGSNTARFLTSTVTDNTIFNSPTLRSVTATPSNFEQSVGQAVYSGASVKTINKFINQSTPAAAYVTASTTPARRLTLVYNSTPQTTLTNFIDNVGQPYLDTVIASLPEVTQVSYTEMTTRYINNTPSLTGLAGVVGDPTNGPGETADTIRLAEHHIYGSSRLGVQRYDTVGYQNGYITVNASHPQHQLTDSVAWYSYQFGDLVDKAYKNPYGHTDLTSFAVGRVVGRRFYEMTDHLGNVLATVMDRKTGHLPTPTSTNYDYWKPDLASVTDYYPFGLQMPGRNLVAGDSNSYPFGFNGKFKDNEVYGAGNFYDYGARRFDPRLGRFISVDPLTKKYPWYTPYQFSGNKPIWATDLDGKEENWGWLNSVKNTYNVAIKVYSSAQAVLNTVDKTIGYFQGTDVIPYAHFEANFTAGVRFAGDLKKIGGVDINLGSATILSVTSDYNFKSNKWENKFEYLGKDGKVTFTEGVSLDLPIGAVVGLPVGVGGSITGEQKVGNGKVDTKFSADAGAGIGIVATKGAYQVEKEDGDKKTTIKGAVSIEGANGAIGVVDYKLETGVKIESKSKSND